MDSVDHPLDWWAYGGYPAVMRELGCTKTVARHKVRDRIAEYYRRTRDPIWKPFGNRGYAALRRRIMEGSALANDPSIKFGDLQGFQRQHIVHTLNMA